MTVRTADAQPPPAKWRNYKLESLSFSSEHFSPADRATLARETYAMIGNIDITDVSGESFKSRMDAVVIQGSSVAMIANSACTVQRSHRHIANGNDDWVFVMVVEGRASIQLAGRDEIECDSGEAYLIRNDIPGRFFMSDVRHVQVAVPDAVIAPRLVNADRMLSRRLDDSTTPELGYLADYGRMLTGLKTPLSAEAENRIATHLGDLLVLALRGKRDEIELAKMRGLRAARLRGVLGDLATHACNGDMNIDMTARRLRISPRYIRKLLADIGTTFSEEVQNARLTRAHDLLTKSTHDHMSIGDIAYSVGFNDLSYFNRVFRRRFGATPSEIRHR